MATIMQKISGLVSTGLINLIRLYQYVLSPWLGRRCRFLPTCSSYAKQALQEYGVVKGCAWAIWRLARCHPWSAGGYDPVDDTANRKSIR